MSDLPLHPDADRLDLTFIGPGRCICGHGLPPAPVWCGWPHQWSHTLCPKCGRLYVDEDDFVMIEDDPNDFECEDCRPASNGRQNPLTHVGREGPEQQIRFEDDGHGDEARP